MTLLNAQNISFRKLFDVKILEQKQTFVGISGSGDLLLITEELAGTVLLYGKQTFWRLEREEFRQYAERARRRGKLQKAIDRGWTSEAEIERLIR